jgi:hypothetical protein
MRPIFFHQAGHFRVGVFPIADIGGSIKLVESVRNGYVCARLGSSLPSKEGVHVNILGR